MYSLDIKLRKRVLGVSKKNNNSLTNCFARAALIATVLLYSTSSILYPKSLNLVCDQSPRAFRKTASLIYTSLLLVEQRDRSSGIIIIVCPYTLNLRLFEDIGIQ
jgi:hypothetical protein